jgi:hypothetical protein
MQQSLRSMSVRVRFAAFQPHLLLALGWDGKRRVYYPVIHINIRNGKFWIQFNAMADGVARDLIAAGVPKEQIVLAFYPLEACLHSEYAVA